MTERCFTARTLNATAALLLGATSLTGCLLEKQDDAEEYREAVPQREAVVVAGPETDDAAGASIASIASARRAQASGPLKRGEYAKWYGFTRAVRGGVNVVTAWVLGSAWAIVNTEPSSLKDGEAIWGPYTDALEPVTYRFRVTRLGEGEYDYVLEGRPKQSSSDDAYLTVLSGHGFGKRRAEHGQGEFTIDLSAARRLDPFNHENDSGTVHIEHQLPHDLARGDALPRTIIAEVTPDPDVNPESYVVKSIANEDGTGSLRVDAKSDVDDTKATQLEAVTVASRFRADGAGRADISITGGDIPADPGVVNAVECWGADFKRSYYEDSIGFAPLEGEASACVYDAP
jgi:hypothetical protein